MKNSKIQWCDHTFNPWEGCTKVSPGCANCFAEARDQRFCKGIHWGKGAPRRRTSAVTWKQPLKWDRERSETLERLEGTGYTAILNHRPRVFCGSLCDIFDDEVSASWVADFLEVVDKCKNLDFLILTKRPENWRQRMQDVLALKRVGSHGGHCLANQWLRGGFPSNVWIGTTVENQEMAVHRIPALLAIPAKVRFLSCEPLLGSVNLPGYSFGIINCPSAEVPGACGAVTALPNAEKIHWVICGGESGPKARPMHPDWARSLRDQCKAAGVPFLFKQWGEWIPESHFGGELESVKHHGESAASANGRSPVKTYSWEVMQFPLPESPKRSFRVGKKFAGRLLDGVEHNELPNTKER